MTYQQILDEADYDRDYFASGWIPPPQALIILYDALNEYVEQAYHDFEKTEKIREDLRSYVIQSEFIATTFPFPLSLLTGFNYMLSVDLGFTVAGVTTFVQARSVTWDKLEMTRRDPFSKPTKRNPIYYQRTALGNPVLIPDAGTSAADSILVTYLKTPFQPTQLQLGNTADLPDQACREVAKIMARKMDLITGAYNEYPLQENEIMEQK